MPTVSRSWRKPGRSKQPRLATYPSPSTATSHRSSATYPSQATAQRSVGIRHPPAQRHSTTSNRLRSTGRPQTKIKLTPPPPPALAPSQLPMQLGPLPELKPNLMLRLPVPPPTNKSQLRVFPDEFMPEAKQLVNEKLFRQGKPLPIPSRMPPGVGGLSSRTQLPNLANFLSQQQSSTSDSRYSLKSDNFHGGKVDSSSVSGLDIASVRAILKRSSSQSRKPS
eukprot:894317_1